LVLLEAFTVGGVPTIIGALAPPMALLPAAELNILVGLVVFKGAVCMVEEGTEPEKNENTTKLSLQKNGRHGEEALKIILTTSPLVYTIASSCFYDIFSELLHFQRIAIKLGTHRVEKAFRAKL
jgi:hypothetical protein